MILFRSAPFFLALIISILLAVLFGVLTVVIRVFCASGKKEKAHRVKIIYAVQLLCACLMGAFISDSVMIGRQIHTAFKHGLARVPETAESEYAGKYRETLGQVIAFNQLTHELSDVSIDDDMVGKIMIFVRYDCGDCHHIYNELLDVCDKTEDVYYIGSRSDIGHEIIDKYRIDLNEVPSAVLVTDNGTVYVKVLYTGSGENIEFNYAGWQDIIAKQHGYFN